MGWVHDFFEIELAKVSMPQLDTDWQLSKGYSRQDMQKWIQHLSEIQRLCHQENYTEADFQRMRQSYDSREQALGETYSKFYDHNINNTYVKVAWDDKQQKYEVDNGRHRVWLAKQQGLRYLPAKVSAPNTPILAKLKADGEQVVLAEKLRLKQETETQKTNYQKLKQLKANSSRVQANFQKLEQLKKQSPDGSTPNLSPNTNSSPFLG